MGASLTKKESAKILPDFFQPLFWSYDFENIDAERDKKLIVRQTVLYGNLRHLGWVEERYGRPEIRRILSLFSSTEIRPSAQKLLSLLFDVSFSSHAPRGAR